MIQTLIYCKISLGKYVPKNLISLLYYFKFSFRRRYFIIYKTDSVNVPTQIHDFERRLSTQTQYLLLIHRGNVLFVSN